MHHMKIIGNEDDDQFFNIGACGLQIFHRAYKTPHKVTEWQITNSFKVLIIYFMTHHPGELIIHFIQVHHYLFN